MAALRGTLQGMRGTVSRLGSKNSGIESVLNTWNGGITTRLGADGQFTVTVKQFSGEFKPDKIFYGNVDDATTLTK